MNKLQRPAALLSILPTFFFRGTTTRNVVAALQRRRRLPPILHPTPVGRAAFSTHPYSSAGSAASENPQPAAATPITTTVSRCAPEADRGRHVFEIAGYSLVKGLGGGNFVQSGTFSVGGYDWCIQYYPDGSDDWSSDSEDEDEEDEDERYISVFVTLVSKGAAAVAPQVRVLCDLRLVNRKTGQSLAPCSGIKGTRVFSSADSTRGYERFMHRGKLEASEYIQDDCLVIQCDIFVVKGMPVSQSKPVSDVNGIPVRYRNPRKCQSEEEL